MDKEKELYYQLKNLKIGETMALIFPNKKQKVFRREE